MRNLSSFLIAAACAIAPAVADASNAQARFGALLDGLVFFGGMIVLVIVAAALRLRDARSGLTPEQKQARLKARLPWVMGVFFGLVAYILFRSM